jgi:hypothetical protein
VALCVTAVAISAPAAGAAKFIPGYTDFPNALRVGDELRASQDSGYIAGYTDFPNALRAADELRASQDSGYIAGYTDFPNALRVADELRASQDSGYIAGYTDFPNALRVADELRASQEPVPSRDAGHVRQAGLPPRVKSQAVSHAFDWGDAGIGAGTAVGAFLLLLGMTGVVRRRASHASAH